MLFIPLRSFLLVHSKFIHFQIRGLPVLRMFAMHCGESLVSRFRNFKLISSFVLPISALFLFLLAVSKEHNSIQNLRNIFIITFLYRLDRVLGHLGKLGPFRSQ